jgi:hypothetical protein
MNWEIIGSTGEWAGAFVVGFTLIYLAVQIRQQNRISRYEAWASIIDGLNQHLVTVTPDTAMAYTKGRDQPADCDGAELMVFQNGFRIFFNNTQKAFRAYQFGFLSEAEWLVFAKTFAAELDTPGGRIWRAGNEATDRDLFEAVDAAGEGVKAELDLRAGDA